jgi:hypothetical protein
MTRLPEPKLVLVKVEPDEENEQRMKDFKSILRKAVRLRHTAEMKKEKEIG